VPDLSPLEPGDPAQLAGFRLTGRLGEGGQGVVYLGEGPSGQRVAIKVLQALALGNAQARTRFGREVSAARRVGEFCTAKVLAADVEGDVPYLVSEFIDGVSLQDAVRRGGPVRGADLDRLAIGMATALAAIHRAGIVHRDFKPANVLLSARGPRVVDFGIARALDSVSTLTSQAIGTPAYMAPEQLRGGTVGPAADVFSWACTVVYAATGTPPFGADSVPAVVKRITRDEPMLAGLVDGPLAETVARCLAKDPAARPAAEDVLLCLLGRPAPAAVAPAGSAGRAAAEDTLVLGAQVATHLDVRPYILPPAPPTAPPTVGSAPAYSGRGASRRRVLAGAGVLAAATAAGGIAVAARAFGHPRGGRSAGNPPGGGRTLWHHDFGAAGFFRTAVGAGTVFLQDARGLRLFAVDAATGRQRWSWKFQVTAMTAAGSVLYLADLDNLYALDAATGRRRWLVAAPASPARLAVAGDLLVVTANDHDSGDVVVRGLGAADGRTRWTTTLPAGGADPFLDAGSVRDPTVRLPDTDILTVTPTAAVIGNEYGIAALATATGKGMWRFAPRAARGSLSRPLAVGDTVYVGRESSGSSGSAGSTGATAFWALAAATGEVRWTSPHGVALRSSPVPFVAGAEAVYVGGSDDDVLYALDARSGRERWRRSPGNQPDALAGDTVYMSDPDFAVLALDAATGRLRWRWDEGKKSRTDPFYRAASGDAAFYTLGSGSGDLYALRAH
jgi:outer membrane protein assembly factor BamB/predicted Ser/Thr protein kinase